MTDSKTVTDLPMLPLGSMQVPTDLCSKKPGNIFGTLETVSEMLVHGLPGGGLIEILFLFHHQLSLHLDLVAASGGTW